MSAEQRGDDAQVSGVLDGVTVLELGSFIAGPFAGQFLGDHGAMVIKVEPPQVGDPMRQWGNVVEGESLWWPTIARNKKSIAVDMRDPRGRDVVRRLATRVDVVLENFKPGRLEEWGLDYESLRIENPRLIMTRVSGFGQSGPRSPDPGFGSVGEAIGGIRYTTGDPDRPPSRAGVSLGDSLAALVAVIGTLGALYEREKSGLGQQVDVAIYEAVLALMESTMADYQALGVIRERTGSVLAGVAPSNVYPTKDGVDVLIAANADAVFARLCEAMGQPVLRDDERFRSHQARGANMEVLDEIVGAWTQTLIVSDLIEILREHQVPVGEIFTAREMLADPHYRYRNMVVEMMSRSGRIIPMPGTVPKFSRTEGTIRDVGPRLGEDTFEILRSIAKLEPDLIDELAGASVVAGVVES